MKELIKKFLPVKLLALYHKFLALAANWLYGNPSKKLIVIGVTGTNGKSTTVMLIAKILEEAGYKVGATSTAIFKIADKEWLNKTKMTMLGRLALQKMLRQMVRAGCQYAVVETSSQGIEQFRHIGINYDVAVFTNLTPEHIEAHGGFDNYKTAKLKLFKKLEREKNKTVGDKQIKKIIIVNGDDAYSSEFLNFKTKEKIIFGLNNNSSASIAYPKAQQITAEKLEFMPAGVNFSIAENIFHLHLLGRFNVYNALAAIAVATSQDISKEVCRRALEKVTGLPGRMEFISEGKNFKLLIDYAPEPESMRQLFQTISDHKIIKEGNKIIHVFGSCGGGRDVARRPILGELSAKHADYLVITNEDPYDDDPQTIIDQVALGAVQAGKILGENLFKIASRREAIAFALSLAQAGDLVLLTGKGSEQAICVGNSKKLPWDERQVAREELLKVR